MPKVTLTELKQYIVDLSEGLGMRLDDLDDCIKRIETDVAIVKEHLVTEMRAQEREPEPGTPFGKGT